ncbi:MAG: GtrA family protein [Abitibacteriaceae bacterium]|nr:GtrA family protein [Abditibacteriaceae bacterium]MBV9868070.1 GtrA family protein [Abditibacteriaceae bacterium]
MNSLDINSGEISSKTPLLQRPGVQQLIKFCLVGATSTVVDKGVLWVLLKFVPALPWYISATISFCLGVTNGFIWNRRWTFHEHRSGAVKEQYPKFFASNVVGWMLNLSITKFFLVIFTGQVLHKSGNPAPFLVITASLCAIPIVVVWNFAASKYWTFRTPKPAAS